MMRWRVCFCTPDEIWFQLSEVWYVVECGLWDDLIYAFYRGYDLRPLFVGQIWQSFIACDGGVGEYADGDATEFCSLVDDVEMAGVDHVGAHADVYFLLLHKGCFIGENDFYILSLVRA